jgi:hypothetical protein
MTGNSNTTLALCWYTPESYAALRAVDDEPVEDPTSYAEFLVRANRLAADFKRQGVRVEKVLIDIDLARQWCRDNGFKFDNAGRSAYCAAICCMLDKPGGRT